MVALNDELEATSDAIARTMAEAAAAPLLGDAFPPHTTATASLTPVGVVAGADPPVSSSGRPQGTGSAGGVGGVGRSREEAQAEVNRLKVRQMELFELIRRQREVMAKTVVVV